ncbi:autotransporter outer membrane beta-barrel domain-containing protein [Escherichia coli]
MPERRAKLANLKNCTTPGNVLTVNGNYTGNNGLMTFNATLGGDNSPTDKMNVKGDTQGNVITSVTMVNSVSSSLTLKRTGSTIAKSTL